MEKLGVIKALTTPVDENGSFVESGLEKQVRRFHEQLEKLREKYINIMEERKQ